MPQSSMSSRLNRNAFAFVLAGGGGSRMREFTDRRAKPAGAPFRQVVREVQARIGRLLARCRHGRRLLRCHVHSWAKLDGAVILHSAVDHHRLSRAPRPMSTSGASRKVS